MDINSLAHTKWNCKYHIVFAPKYRRKVAYGKMKQDIANILSMLCKTPVYNFINDRFSDKQTFCAVPFFRISDIGKNFLIAKDA